MASVHTLDIDINAPCVYTGVIGQAALIIYRTSNLYHGDQDSGDHCSKNSSTKFKTILLQNHLTSFNQT